MTEEERAFVLQDLPIATQSLRRSRRETRSSSSKSTASSTSSTVNEGKNLTEQEVPQQQKSVQKEAAAAEDVLSECPLCSNFFSKSKVEAHAAVCGVEEEPVVPAQKGQIVTARDIGGHEVHELLEEDNSGKSCQFLVFVFDIFYFDTYFFFSDGAM